MCRPEAWCACRPGCSIRASPHAADGTVSGLSKALGRAVIQLSPAPRKVPSPPAHRALHTCGMKLLLVEDDDSMARALRLALERRGFEVDVCSNGTDALQRLRFDPPEVTLLDLTIPGLDGLSVLQKARTHGVTTPILVLTARGAVGDRIQGLNAGADD